MRIEYGQKVRVTNVGDGNSEHLEGKELWLDDYDRGLGFFVDGDPNPNNFEANNNSDYGYVDGVEPVVPPEFIERERYFVDGVRKVVLLDDPAPAAQDGHVEEPDDEPVLEPEGFTPPGHPRPRPILTNLATGEEVDSRWLLEQIRLNGAVEVGVQPDVPIPTTITAEEVNTIAADMFGKATEGEPTIKPADVVNHPSHYTAGPMPVECIEVVEWMSFCRGNAIKYIWRAGQKDPAKEVEDLEKARWYIDREIDRIRRVQA